MQSVVLACTALALALALACACARAEQVTIVSAYYRIASKHSSDEYAHWMTAFFRIDAPIVFFCNDSSEAARMHSLRPPELPPLRVIVLPLEQLDTHLLFTEDVWRRQFYADPERAHHRSPLLYQIWLQKARFVTRAAEALHARNDTLFLWADAGFARLPHAAQEIGDRKSVV